MTARQIDGGVLTSNRAVTDDCNILFTVNDRFVLCELHAELFQ